MNSTPLCLRVVLLLCSVSVRITPLLIITCSNSLQFRQIIKKNKKNYSLAPQITTCFVTSRTNSQYSDSSLLNYQNV
jgi:hypothetical protein